MDKRFWICGTAVSFVALLLTLLVHGVLLAPDYAALAHEYRDARDSARQLPWVLLAHALLGYAMTWIFSQGFASDRQPLRQGLRFGLAMALFAAAPAGLLAYAAQPLPAAFIARQIVYGTASMMLLGVLLAWLQPRRHVLRAPR
jgi:uncharacterized protein (TIGR03382 family)